MKRSGTLIVMAAAVILAGLANWYYKPVTNNEEVHIHAGFIVYIDGVRQDYSEFKYMDIGTCSEEEHDDKLSKDEIQAEKAHLHDGVGDVVHSHIAGAKWRDLFTNIKVELPMDKEIKGYIDGKEVSNFLSEPISTYSSALILVGTSDIDHSQELVTTEHIKDIESKSESCGDAS